MDDIAGIDQAHAHAAVARRGDGGVVELGLRGLDRRLVGGDRGLELIDLGLLLVDDLLRCDVREHQRLRSARGPFSAEVSWAWSCAFLALA